MNSAIAKLKEALAIPDTDPDKSKKLEDAKDEYKKKLEDIIRTKPILNVLFNRKARR